MQLNSEEEKATTFLEDAEEQLRMMTEKSIFIEWAYESNINDENEKKKLQFQVFFFFFAMQFQVCKFWAHRKCPDSRMLTGADSC